MALICRCGEKVSEGTTQCPRCGQGSFTVKGTTAPSGGDWLEQTLTVFGMLMVLGGIILGIIAAQGLSGEYAFVAFVTPTTIGFFASLTQFWMAQVLKNQKLTMQKLDKLNQDK